MGKEPPATPPFNIVIFAQSKVLNAKGSEVQIGKLWQKQTTMFVFLRHFACIACRAHATQVWKNRASFEKNGAKIVFIGNGSPDFIDKFKVDLGIKDAVIYTDPTLAAFRAAGFKRGFLAALGPTAITNGLKMLSQGNTQAAYQKAAGDLWQLGGIVVVRVTGQIAYHYISQVLGDFPPQDDVLTE